MKSIENIANYIDVNSIIIVDNIPNESPYIYLFLKEQFENSDVSSNLVFQFLYRSFYRLDNAGLTSEFKYEYFRIMESHRDIDSFDVRNILDKLYQITNLKRQSTIQFSFVTKMMNTINDNHPIYDNEVRKVFGFIRPSYSMSKEKRIDEYLLQLAHISHAYSTILNRFQDNSALIRFDQRFQNVQIGQVKKLDFIMWSAGKML
jgi:hypothetical protein